MKRRRDYRAHKASGKGRAQEGLRQVRDERIAPPLFWPASRHLSKTICRASTSRGHGNAGRGSSYRRLATSRAVKCREVELTTLPWALCRRPSTYSEAAESAAPVQRRTQMALEEQRQSQRGRIRDRSEQAAFLPPITGPSRSVYARVCSDDPGDIESTWAAVSRTRRLRPTRRIRNRISSG